MVEIGFPLEVSVVTVSVFTEVVPGFKNEEESSSEAEAEAEVVPTAVDVSGFDIVIV